VLYDAGADVVLAGHDTYERFAPQRPDATPDPARGIRAFVVGSGGKTHYGFTTPAANSEVRNGTTFGVLKLTLHPTSYDWQFVPEAGQSFTDTGSGSCR
jgi:acid phosphatase type 7